MAVDLGSTFKELIDEINSKGSVTIDSIDGLKGGMLSSPLIVSGGDSANASKIALNSAGKGQITDSSTGTLFGFMSADVLTIGSNNYTTNIRGNANSAIGGKKFSDLAVKSDIPDTSDFVKLSGDNTFTGTNIFSNLLSVGGSTGGTAIGMGAFINVVGPEEMYTLNLPKQNGTLAIDGDYVKLTTDQTISGTKTFTSGSIVASKTDSSNKTMKVAYGCNGIAYTPYGTTSIKLISFPAKDGTFALTSDIPNLTNYVTIDTAQTITGIKIFNAPTNVSGSETTTTKFKTSNGGSITIGKEGPNSGTMLRFDQVDGTCRLRFRGSATAGAMVWSQPEKNAVLYFDMGNSVGSGVNRVTLRNVAGTLALTKELPAVVSANPTLSGSETELTGLQIGSTKYKIPTGGGGSTLDDLEAEYTEDVNAVPVLDVEETGTWIMVPVSALGGGGSEKKYYRHYVTITEVVGQGLGRNDITLNIVSTSNTAFTKDNIYLHLWTDQLCVCKATTYSPYSVTVYSAYILSCTPTQLSVGLIGGDSISPILSSVGLTDSVTLISDL